MKRYILLIAILCMAFFSTFGQIPLRNTLVNQLANGDTIQWRITPSTNYLNSTNLFNFTSKTLFSDKSTMADSVVFQNKLCLGTDLSGWRSSIYDDGTLQLWRTGVLKSSYVYIDTNYVRLSTQNFGIVVNDTSPMILNQTPLQFTGNALFNNAVTVSGILKHDEISSIISVTDGTDITTTLNTYLSSERNLILPAGTFILSDTVIIALDNTNIKGAGMDKTILKIVNSLNGAIFIGNTSTMYNLSISDLTLDGNHTGNATCGFYIDYIDGLKLDKIKVDSCQSLTALTIQLNCNDVHISNSYFIDNLASGLRVLSGVYGDIINNTFTNNGTYGLWYETKDMDITNNMITYNTAGGMYLWNSNLSQNRSAKTQIKGNHINHNGGAGIRMRNSNIMYVEGNNIISNDNEGILAEGITDCGIINNMIQTNDVIAANHSNIELISSGGWNCTGNVIMGNELIADGLPAWGIIGDASAKYNLISNNKIETGTSGYISLADSNEIRNNISDVLNAVQDTSYNNQTFKYLTKHEGVSTFNANIIMRNSATFNNSDADTLEITEANIKMVGNSKTTGNVQVGDTTLYAYGNNQGLIRAYSSARNLLDLTTSYASSSVSGAIISLCEDDGAALPDGHKLGALNFNGSYNNAHGVSTAVSIYSITEGTWSGTSDHGAGLGISTSNDGSSITEKFTIAGIGTVNQTYKLSSQDSLNFHRESSSLADDGTITLATGQSGSGTLYIDSAGFRKILIYFSFQDDGTVWLDASYNTGSGWTTTATSDSDGKVCIYDAGIGAVIKQRLGYRVGARLNVNYATN